MERELCIEVSVFLWAPPKKSKWRPIACFGRKERVLFWCTYSQPLNVMIIQWPRLLLGDKGLIEKREYYFAFWLASQSFARIRFSDLFKNEWLELQINQGLRLIGSWARELTKEESNCLPSDKMGARLMVYWAELNVCGLCQTGPGPHDHSSYSVFVLGAR